MSMLRGSIGTVKDHATPQQLWHLCIPPGADAWTAHLSLGALVANVLLRQMPGRTAAMYLAAWRDVVQRQVAKRRAAGEVLRRMERKRFQEFVRLLFRWGDAAALCKGASRLAERAAFVEAGGTKAARRRLGCFALGVRTKCGSA